MAIYSAYLPPDGTREDARFIADGPAIFALIVPAVYLIWHRLWQPLMAYVLVAGALALPSMLVPSPWLGLLPALPGFFLMLQGRDLVRADLEQKGWHEAASLQADNEADAELRFFSMDLPAKSVEPVSAQVSNVLWKPQIPAAAGIFPE